MKSGYIKLLIFSLVLLKFNLVFPQSSDLENTLAVTGDRTIRGVEFLERYEMSPGINKHSKSSTKSSKINFLYTLIAEKLWALEASAIGLDTIEVMKFSCNAFEKMFVRDELYRREILEKIEISDKELLDGYSKNSTTLKINFLFSEDEEEIKSLYKLLCVGIPFDSILSESPEFEEQPEPIEIVYGQMDKQIEDSLYALNIEEFTAPILTPDGWYIFVLKNRTEQILSRLKDIEDSRNRAGKVIKARKEQELYEKFYINFFNGKSVDVNPVLFESLVQKLSNVLSKKRSTENIRNEDPVFLLANEVLLIEQNFGTDSLKMNFLLLDEEPVTLKNFIRTLAYDGFSLMETDIVSTRALMDYKTRKTIELELIAREGFKRRLHLLPDVQSQVQIWLDNYLFQVLQNQFLDSIDVNDEEILGYYRSLSKSDNEKTLINVVEVLTDSLELVQIILDELQRGVDIKDLAAKFTKRNWTRERNGEFGLTEVEKLGEIGRIALNMEVGDIYGPLKLPEGYSLFKLIEKRKNSESPPPFETAKNEYANRLTRDKLKSKMINFTVQLALKYGLKVDWNFLESIKVTNINSFGIRYLGFGGKITAVPLLAPNNNWVESYFKKLNTIQ